MTATGSPLFSGYTSDHAVVVFACQDKDQLPKIKQVPLSRSPALFNALTASS